MKLKYVRIEPVGFVLWSEHLLVSHADMARFIGSRQNPGQPPVVESAGFVRLTDAGPVCYGHSTSLAGLGTRADDARMLALQLDRYTAPQDIYRPDGATAA